MITYRFQAWRITPERSGTFHRTHRPRPQPTAMLMTRVIDDDRMGRLWLDRPDQRKSRREIQHARPLARTKTFHAGPFYAGPMRCLRKDQWRQTVEFYCDARPYPRGRPLASIAPHRMASFGYVEFPF